LEAGLRFYVGAANMEDDGGYASKVLAEQRHLIQVAAGQMVPVTVPSLVAATANPAASLVSVPAAASSATAPTIPPRLQDVSPPGAPEAPLHEQVALAR
jgi:hypothetical protein